MKITLCVKNLANTGGQERFQRLLGDFLARRGHAVRFLTARAPAQDSSPATHTVPAGRWYPRSMRDWAYARALASSLAHEAADITAGEQKTWDCDILFPNGGDEDQYWINRVRFWRYRTGRPAWFRFLQPKRWFDLLAERNGYASPHLRKVIVNSRMVREWLVGHYPHIRPLTEVVYHGVDTARFNPDLAVRWRHETLRRIGLQPDRLTGVFAGSGFHLKGLPNALAAFAAASNIAPATHMQLIVAGRDRPALFRNMAARLGIADSVRFIGAAPSIEQIYAAADFFILPSFYDPCALVTLEALAAGLPVITSRYNGAHELIDHGRQGWIVDDPRDAGAIAGLIRAFTDKERLAAMKKAARALALEHPWDRKFERIEAIMREVAAGKRQTVDIH